VDCRGWSRTYDVTTGVGVWGLAATADGGVAFATMTERVSGQATGAILNRLDANGGLLSTHTFSSPNKGAVDGLLAVADDDFVFFGSSMPDTASNEEMWSMRVSGAGIATSDQTYSVDAVRSRARAGIRLEDDGVLLAGWKQLAAASSKRDAVIVATDATGNEIWSKTWSQPVDTAFSGAAIVNGGGFGFLGERRTQDMDPGELWLVRTDAAGEELWNYTYPGWFFSEGGAVTAVDAGGFLLAHSVAPMIEDYSHILVIRTDSDGAPVWELTIPSDPSTGDGPLYAESLLSLSDGSFVVFGYKDEGSVALLARVSSTGVLTWTQTYKSGPGGYGRAIALAPEQGLFLGGDGWADGHEVPWVARVDQECGALCAVGSCPP
jgi:hypothetical protein